MSNRRGFWLTPLVFVAACTGLDPEAFKKRGSAPEPDGAGWSFDAGVAPETGGGGSRAIGNGGSGAARTDGGDAEPDGGARSGGSDGGEGMTEEGGGSGGGSGGGTAGTAGRGGSAGAPGGGSATGGSATGGSVTGGRGGQTGAGQGGAGQAGSAGGSTGAHVVFFSEYVEGSSSYKALELTAREDSTLTGCRLVTYFNGAMTGTGIALDASLPAGSTYVLCSSALGPLLEKACDRTTNLTFNGDDAVALECDGSTLDVIGQIGLDPGDAWTSGEASTLNQTLRRRCAASGGDRDGSDAFDPAAEWTALSVDTFDGLGSGECSIEARR